MDVNDLQVTPVGFADLFLELRDLSKKQAEAVMPLMTARVGRKRVNITVVGPNGCGKDTRIIPIAAYYWLSVHKKGRVVITSASDTQISQQTIPALNEYWHRFGWQPPVNSPRYTLHNDGGGELIAFVTNESGRIEGFHEHEGSPLLLIINEAKTIKDSMFTGLDRCTPTAVLQLSSPGLKEGRFYETHASIPGWVRVKMGLDDCPWIPESKRQDVIDKWGKDHPVTRSILFGEFMSQGEDDLFCLLPEEYDFCIEAPPTHIPGFEYGFFDFADGRAENVFARRNGNKYWIEDAWRDTNEDAVVGRAILLLNKSGLSAQQVSADAAAKSILDKVAMAGWGINRINFGSPVKDQPYKSWSVMAWIEFCNKVKRREVILPKDDILRKQLTSRRKLFTPDGRMALMDKHKMKTELGLESPDRGDAIIGCGAAVDVKMFQPRRESWQEHMDEERSFFGSVGY